MLSVIDFNMLEERLNSQKGLFPDELIWQDLVEFAQQLGIHDDDALIQVERVERWWAHRNLGSYDKVREHLDEVYQWTERQRAIRT